MKLTEIWKSKNRPTFSFEFFPAKGDKATSRLNKVIDKLADLEPDFVSVTFGAGGSTREGSLDLAKQLKREKNLELLSYFACFGLSPDTVDSVLDDFNHTEIENVLIVRGDKPEIEGFQPHPESYQHASDLVPLVAERAQFCIGVAGYPEGHKEAINKDKDIEYLIAKVAAGADFVVTNYTYDNEHYFSLVNKVREMGVDVPILPGVMPIFSEKMMYNLAKLCGASIPEKLQRGLADLPEDDKEALLEFGIEYAVEQCRSLIEFGVPGLHFYTMDKSKSCLAIVRKLKNEGLI